MDESYTTAIPQAQKPIDLKSMADALKIAGPKNWMLIDPQGRVLSGPDPMVLAAHATYKPLAALRADQGGADHG